MEKALEEKILEIIERSSLKGEWVSMAELSYETNLNERSVRKIVTNIRENDSNDKIIIGCSKGYKILSEEEEIAYLKSKKISILNSLRRYYKDIKRFSSNNNYKLNLEEENLDLMRSIGF